MVSRCKYSGSSEIGAFCLLTNNFALVPYTNENFLNHFTIDLPESMPIIQTNIAQTSLIGRMAVGNKHGLLLPSTATDDEIEHILKQLPDDVVIDTCEEPFSALGNVIAANDHIAIVNPSLDQETIEKIQDTLNVEVVPVSVGNGDLVGTYIKFTNIGGVISNDIPIEKVEEINSILGLDLVSSSVNRGSTLISSGLCVNDSTLICGFETSALEISNLSRAFRVESSDYEMTANLPDIFDLSAIQKLVSVF